MTAAITYQTHTNTPFLPFGTLFFKKKMWPKLRATRVPENQPLLQHLGSRKGPTDEDEASSLRTKRVWQNSAYKYVFIPSQ